LSGNAVEKLEKCHLVERSVVLTLTSYVNRLYHEEV